MRYVVIKFKNGVEDRSGRDKVLIGSERVYGVEVGGVFKDGGEEGNGRGRMMCEGRILSGVGVGVGGGGENNGGEEGIGRGEGEVGKVVL